VRNRKYAESNIEFDSSLGYHPKACRISGAAAEVSSLEEVIDQALDALEQTLFCRGFASEAEAYLSQFPRKQAERNTFGRVYAS
jgi:hypothetical protein